MNQKTAIGFFIAKNKQFLWSNLIRVDQCLRIGRNFLVYEINFTQKIDLSRWLKWDKAWIEDN